MATVISRAAARSAAGAGATTAALGTTASTVTTATVSADLGRLAPLCCNLGLEATAALEHYGFELRRDDASVQVPAEDAERWLQFIPIALELGTQLYSALSREGLLAADRALPRDASPERSDRWQEVLQLALGLGVQIYGTLSREGYVATTRSAALPVDPDAQAVQERGWLDLVPIALQVGTQIYNALTAKGLVAADPQEHGLFQLGGVEWHEVEANSRLSDNDVLGVTESDIDPATIEIVLENATPQGWWKGIEILNNSDQQVGFIEAEGRGSVSTRLPVATVDVEVGGSLVFWKAKLWGVHSPIHRLHGLGLKRGKSLRFHWSAD